MLLLGQNAMQLGKIRFPPDMLGHINKLFPLSLIGVGLMQAVVSPNKSIQYDLYSTYIDHRYCFHRKRIRFRSCVENK